MTALQDYFLNGSFRVLCAYILKSVQAFGPRPFDRGRHIFALDTTPDPNITAWVPAGSTAREVAEARGWNWKETPVT